MSTVGSKFILVRVKLKLNYSEIFTNSYLNIAGVPTAGGTNSSTSYC